jgi:hypothetical protein
MVEQPKSVINNCKNILKMRLYCYYFLQKMQFMCRPTCGLSGTLGTDSWNRPLY